MHRSTVRPARRPAGRFLASPDLSWARRTVVLLTILGTGRGGVQQRWRRLRRRRAERDREHRQHLEPAELHRRPDHDPGQEDRRAARDAARSPTRTTSTATRARKSMSPNVQGALTARLRAEPPGQHGLGDRPRHDAGHRHVPRRHQPAAHRAVVGPQDALVDRQRRGPHRRLAHRHRPATPASPGSGSWSTTRTTCTSRPTARRRSWSPRRASDSTSTTRTRGSSRARSTCPTARA